MNAAEPQGSLTIMDWTMNTTIWSLLFLKSTWPEELYTYRHIDPFWIDFDPLEILLNGSREEKEELEHFMGSV